MQTLWNSSAASPTKVYQVPMPYMSGGKILLIQQARKAAGCDPIELDGVYGPHTATAVTNLQTSKGLLANGIVDTQTAAALNIQL